MMSMLEVGYQFRSFAKTMIASEGSVPSAGWTYAEILGKLAHESEDAEITEIAADFVREFIEKKILIPLAVRRLIWRLGI